MTKKLIASVIAVLVCCVTGCQGVPSLQTTEDTTISNLNTPLPTSFTPTSIPETKKIIPADYYRIIKTKFSTFHNGEIQSSCLQINSHKTTKVISDEVIEVSVSSEYQSIIGDCSSDRPKQWIYQLNVYIGEFINSPGYEQVTNSVYMGKDYITKKEDVFFLSSAPIPVWKVRTPISRKDVLNKIVVYEGIGESLFDKETGILIYAVESFTYIQDPTYTFTSETISLSTNALIGGVLHETEFSYSKED